MGRPVLSSGLDRGCRRGPGTGGFQRQALTGQIRDDLAYCQANGYEFVLITDNATTLTPELQALVDKGEINHVRMDFQS
ncbi:hypothetical protein IU448_21310 [Nocardia flavorosea]|nr:hypothetical protein [Nocardia flavorosea]